MINKQESRAENVGVHAREGEGVKKTKYSESEVKNIVKELREEYEEVTGAQKQRILLLREDIEDKSKKLVEAEKERVDIACALLNARKCADTMVREARLDAKKIIEDAKKKRDKLREEIKVYEMSLYTIKTVCAGIIDEIDEGEYREHTLAMLRQNRPVQPSKKDYRLPEDARQTS